MRIQSSSNLVEQRFLISEAQVDHFMKCIAKNIEEDEHFKYTVYNIYYTEVSDDLISKVFKQRTPQDRIRLRSYGIPSNNDPVYIEVKDSEENITTKCRIEMSLDEAHEYLSKQHECGDNQIDELLRNIDLLPKIFVGYERIAYCSKYNPQVRITFSMNIRTRNEDFRLCDLPLNKPLFKEDTILLTVKGEELPEWLLVALKECHLNPMKDEKSGREFKNKTDRIQLTNKLI